MAKTKVALVLSGGTSLGAYIAGALDELTIAFAASDAYEIDIITGASAGATTAAVIAHGLAHRGGKTALHDVWVQGIDILDLLAPDAPPAEPLTLLSVRPLRRLMDQQLAWAPAQGAGQRAAFCAETLTLAMTLANVTPLPYVSRVQQPTPAGREPFIQYRHAEQETFALDRSLLPTDQARWGRIAEVALASAAVPFVFPLVPLARKADAPGQYLHRPEFAGPVTFWYFDGGLLNNQPVDLAWHYAAAAAGSPQARPENRRIVVVNPRRGQVGNITSPAPPNLVEQALGLLGALRAESSAITFDRELARPASAARARAAPDSSLESLPGVDRPPVDVLGTFALVMPRQGEPDLRGLRLSAFSGFLDRKFREYDFRRGAADAQRVARGLLAIENYDANRPPGFYQPDADPTLRFDLAEYEALDEVPSTREPSRSVRAVFEAALERRIKALLGRWDAPGPDLVTDPLLTGFIKNALLARLPAAWKNTRLG